MIEDGSDRPRMATPPGDGPYRSIAAGLGRLADQWEIANLIAWRKLTHEHSGFYDSRSSGEVDDKIQRKLGVRKNR